MDKSKARTTYVKISHQMIELLLTTYWIKLMLI